MLTPLPGLLPAHPELSFAEHRTAAEIARRLTALGYEVTAGVGRTGVVGLLRNGDGPTVLLRADIDALPLAERTGLPYASSVIATDARGQAVPVMHACGHDLHITWLIGAATLFGPGGHGSRPERTVDPVVLAASTVMRLQTVVSREIAASDVAVVTVGTLHAGTKENIIPDDAELTVNIRTFELEVRARVLTAVDRIIRGEAAAAGAPRPPRIEKMYAFDALTNDAGATVRVADAFTARVGADRVGTAPSLSGSEDFGVFGSRGSFPTVVWLVGGVPPVRYEAAERADRVNEDIASNHSPIFAPVLETTLPTGVETLVTAALLWLGPPSG